jgi:hypothetical protein
VQVQFELLRTRSEIASRSLPLQMGMLWQNRLLLETTVGDDLMITGPFVMVDRNGTTAYGT